MKQFAERLSWAMKCAGFDPARDQSRIAALIGKPCKPQNIQHLLNPENEVEHSKYTLDLAEVLGCDPFWLGRNRGTKPTMAEPGKATAPYQYSAPSSNVSHMIATPVASHYVWPFKSFTLEEFNELDESLRKNFEAIILASIGNRGHPEKQKMPATHKASA